MNKKLLEPRVQWLILVMKFENRWRDEKYGKREVPVTGEAPEIEAGG